MIYCIVHGLNALEFSDFFLFLVFPLPVVIHSSWWNRLAVLTVVRSALLTEVLMFGTV